MSNLLYILNKATGAKTTVNADSLSAKKYQSNPQYGVYSDKTAQTKASQVLQQNKNKR